MTRQHEQWLIEKVARRVERMDSLPCSEISVRKTERLRGLIRACVEVLSILGYEIVEKEGGQ